MQQGVEESDCLREEAVTESGSCTMSTMSVVKFDVRGFEDPLSCPHYPL